MWREGASGAMIGAAIGKTREAIIGAMHRAGVRQGSKNSANDKRFKPGPRRNYRAAPMAQSKFRLFPILGASNEIRRNPPAPVKMDTIPSAPESLRLPMTQLETGRCHWPTHEQGGLHLFCGQPTDPF
jgi:hypothetical protein